jgi:hypothetical protein
MRKKTIVDIYSQSRWYKVERVKCLCAATNIGYVKIMIISAAAGYFQINRSWDGVKLTGAERVYENSNLQY